MTRLRSAGVGAMVCGLIAASVLGVVAAGAVAAPRAQAARTLSVTESARLHRVSLNGSVLKQRGTATGTLSGPVSARFEIGVTRVTGTVTISTSAGSLTFTALGNLQSAAGGKARYTGTLAVRSGTGRYARAVGTCAWEGVVDRSKWTSVVSARGTLRI